MRFVGVAFIISPRRIKYTKESKVHWPARVPFHTTKLPIQKDAIWRLIIFLSCAFYLFRGPFIRMCRRRRSFWRRHSWKFAFLLTVDRKFLFQIDRSDTRAYRFLYEEILGYLTLMIRHHSKVQMLSCSKHVVFDLVMSHFLITQSYLGMAWMCKLYMNTFLLIQRTLSLKILREKLVHIGFYPKNNKRIHTIVIFETTSITSISINGTILLWIENISYCRVYQSERRLSHFCDSALCKKRVSCILQRAPLHTNCTSLPYPFLSSKAVWRAHCLTYYCALCHKHRSDY